MKAITKILAGAAGVAAIVASAPAAAQYGGYPGYGAYPGYGYGNTNVVGSILNSILGGRSYGQNDRQAVEQCVRAAEYYINTHGLDNEGGRYRNYGYGYGYNNAYANGYAGARVTAVTQVTPKSNGKVKVYGYATTGQNGGYGYGYNNAYANGYAGARVTAVTQVTPKSNGRIKVYGYATTGQNGGYGGYGGYGGGYSPYGYGNQGYGYDRNGYGAYGYQAQGDARFNCTIDRYGRVTDVDASRNYAGAYPYRRY